MTKGDIFGKEYFEGESGKPGYYQKRYDFNRLYPSFEFTAAQIKSIFKPKTVLDIGCAKGFFALAFRNRRIEAYGVDTSEYAISNAPIEIMPFIYKVDIEKDNLPFDNKYFDFIIFFETIEYLRETSHILQEIKRVLKREGIVYQKTVPKRRGNGDIRINVHDKKFWITEFEKVGFKFIQNNDFVKSLLIYEIKRNFTVPRLNPTVKFKIGKLLFNMGCERVLSWILSGRYHDLLFKKMRNEKLKSK